jgi:2-polyprenyl-6-methoxyphenol hydroxylase-like FAD-dependent oxidoreductase
LFASAAAHPRIRILSRTAIESFAQDECGVSAVARDLDSGEQRSVACRYLVGCDGGKSMIRKAIGAMFSGTSEIQRVQSTYIRAPDLIKLLRGKAAWMYSSLNPRRCGTVIAVDGAETWQIHNALYDGETGFDAVERDWAIRAILGVGPDFSYEVISKEDWIGRRLVANRFRDRRVFICGDAAHLWMPAGGYGMNAGIADATNLSWLIAATLNGWARPAILDAYEAERQPVTEQVSRFTMDSGSRMMKQRREITAKSNGRGLSERPCVRASAKRPSSSTSSGNAAPVSISDISTRTRPLLPTMMNYIPPTRCAISPRPRSPAVVHRTYGLMKKSPSTTC